MSYKTFRQRGRRRRRPPQRLSLTQPRLPTPAVGLLDQAPALVACSRERISENEAGEMQLVFCLNWRPIALRIARTWALLLSSLAA